MAVLMGPRRDRKFPRGPGAAEGGVGTRGAEEGGGGGRGGVEGGGSGITRGSTLQHRIDWPV